MRSITVSGSGTHHAEPGKRLRRRLVAVVAVACLVLAACGSQDAAQNASATTVQQHTQTTTAPATQEPAQTAMATSQQEIPSMVLETSLGDPIDVADLQGQDAMLWFWAPW